MQPVDLEATVVEPAPEGRLAISPGGAGAGSRLRRRRPANLGPIVAASWAVVVLGSAVLADLLPLPDPRAIDASAGRAAPSLDHWLGADQLGRDILSRSIFGARVSLLVAFGATISSGTLGVLLGMLAGYRRGLWETVIMGAMDILLAFPALVLAIALTSFLGPSATNLILALAILGLPTFARVARAQTLSFAERDFVKAARSVGAGRFRILSREIAPNIVPTMVAYAMVAIAVAIVVESSLSFIGLGVSSETPTWGAMIAGGRADMRAAPHISLIPALIMFLTVLAFNGLGDELQRRYAPGRAERL
jgi:peptide/nickel transport system permease protein